MFGNWQAVVALVVAVLIAYAVILWVGLMVWVYRDSRERTRDGWFQSAALGLVLLFNIPGLFIYLILRPSETLMEAHERRLEAEALMRDMADERPVCPRCERTIKDDYLVCPYCRNNLREPCLGCGRPLELTWAACPYCGAQGPQAVFTPGAQPATRAAPPITETPPSELTRQGAPQPASTPQAGTTGRQP